MYRLIITFVSIIVLLASCKKPKDNYEVVVPSPNGQLHLHFNLYNGEPYYLVYLEDEIVVSWSLLGFKNENSESLQESMLALEAGPIKNDDELSSILPGEKYNSLKVHLQKQGNSEINYDLVFLIFDETVLFWYEYDPGLKKIKTNLTENTELDLNMKNQEWTLSDSLQMTDTLYSPVEFRSSLGTTLTFSQNISKKNNGSYLLQREDNKPEFLISSKSKVNLEGAPGQETKVKTPVKNLHIHRNK